MAKGDDCADLRAEFQTFAGFLEEVSLCGDALVLRLHSYLADELEEGPIWVLRADGCDQISERHEALKALLGHELDLDLIQGDGRQKVVMDFHFVHDIEPFVVSAERVSVSREEFTVEELRRIIDGLQQDARKNRRQYGDICEFENRLAEEVRRWRIKREYFTGRSEAWVAASTAMIRELSRVAEGLRRWRQGRD